MHYKARADNVAWRVVDGEAVLVHAQSSAYYGLNRTGTVLWEALIDGPRSVDEFVDDLAERLNAPPLQAREDIDSFLVSLVGAGLAAEEQDEVERSTGRNGITFDSGASVSYEAPQLTPFGELEQLILSGE